MNNANMPAMPHDIVFGKGYPLNYDPTGLTKREQACLIMGVADTGDAELDAIITKGNKQSLAGLAMQGSMADEAEYLRWSDLAKDSLAAADAVLKALGQDNE